MIRSPLPFVLYSLTLSTLANVSPVAPFINEPEFDGQIVNPADVHLESGPFSDPDGGLDGDFRNSDYEIWTITPNERVWSSLDVTGVESFHNHLGDGIFENSHAGRVDLLYATDYRLRMRHRDNSNDPATEYSVWSERLFTTGSANAIFPILLLDVLGSPVPEWKGGNGFDMILPAGATPPKLTVRAEDDEFDLLVYEGNDGVTNTVTNPVAGSHDHAFKVLIEAGSVALNLAESTLVFSDNLAVVHTVYLPAMSLASGQAQLLWVSQNGSSYYGTLAQTSPDFSSLARGSAVPWIVRQPGYKVEVVASGFRNPANIAFIPNPGPNPEDPLYYVTELYGTVKVVRRNGVVSDYASNLLNYTPSGAFPGSGEQGLGGIVVEPVTGDVYLGQLYNNPGTGNNPRVVKFTSVDGGLTAATQTVLLDMAPEAQGQSHFISNFTIGPDGKLYVHNGDGFDAGTAQNLDQFRGKILRMNLDGTPVTDNPYYNAGNGINSRDYIWASGVRNPWGGAWRESDGAHYNVENGPSQDRFSRVSAGQNLGWTGNNNDMTIGALYIWNPSTGPTNIDFIETTVFGGSGFPAGKADRAYVALSGPTYGGGPQGLGKRIEEFEIDGSGTLVSGPSTLVEYNGSGRATACGLAAGPDGLYFTDLYKDLDTTGPTDLGANVLRISYVGFTSFDADVRSGDLPLTVQFTDESDVPGASSWLWDFGDGSSSASQDPSHTYTVAGLYDVTLTVTGTGGPITTRRASYIAAGVDPPSNNFRYFRFSPTKLRDDGAANSTQLAEFDLFLGGGSVVAGSGVVVTNPGGNNPGGEEPVNAADGDTGTKWLDFNKGALVYDFGGSASIDAYALTTGGDAPERDPVSWVLEGSDDGTNWTVIDVQNDYPTPAARETSTGSISALTENPPLIVDFSADKVFIEPGEQVILSWDTIGADTVTISPTLGTVSPTGTAMVAPTSGTTYTLTASNSFGVVDAQVAVTVSTRTEVSYRYFRFSPIELRDDLGSNSVQLAEFDFFLSGVVVGGATASNPGGNTPPGEEPGMAVDDDVNTKWLDFNREMLVLDFGTSVTVDGYGFTTANDADGRDPVSWTMEGSLDNASWFLLDTVTGFPTPTARFTSVGDLPMPDVSQGQVALLVVAEATNPNVAEQNMKTNLEEAGFVVTYATDSETTTADANGKALIVISSTVTAGQIGTKFTGVAVPVLCCDWALYDDLGMTGNLAADHGLVAGQTQITILDPTNPLAKSHSGTLTVYDAPNTMNWGVPNGNAHQIASIVGDAGKIVMFGYEAGASMVTGSAPARRVGYFLGDTGGENAFDHGWHLFKHSASWLVNTPPVVTLDAPGDGGTFAPGQSILLQATPTDSNLTGVDFYDGASYLGSVTIPPYELNWLSPPAGVHVLTAVAVDAVGESAVSNVANVTVNSPFDVFREGHFSPAELADPNISGPNADFDNDGLSTLLEHFFGLDPKVADMPLVYGVARVEDAGSEFGEFSFRYSLSATDVSFEPEASFLLAVSSWESGGDRLEFVGSVDHGDGTRTATYRSLMSDQTREFFRIRVELN